MKTKKEYIRILKESSVILKDRFKISEMILFGSVARSENTKDSDVDLFVSMPGEFYLAGEANDYLESLLDCHVDLIRDHSNITPYLRSEVKKDGIKIF